MVVSNTDDFGRGESGTFLESCHHDWGVGSSDGPGLVNSVGVDSTDYVRERKPPDSYSKGPGQGGSK